MPKNKSEYTQFVVLPTHGLVANQEASTESAQFLSLLNDKLRNPKQRSSALALKKVARPLDLQVVDSIRDNGVKLIEVRDSDVADLRAQAPGLRIIPVVHYHTARAPRPEPLSAPRMAAGAAALKITLTVVSSQTAKPIQGAKLVAFTDFASRAGLDGSTDSKGAVSFGFGTTRKRVQRLYVYPGLGFWPGLREDVTLMSGMTVSLTPIDLGFSDALRFFFGQAKDNDGVGVKVGVVDCGIAQHKDLRIDGGLNTVTGEDPNDFGDNGLEGHGTHVAGIVAARGIPATGVRGLAPGVTLRSYRVFGKGGDDASNFAIAKAIDRAVADGCDLLNLSLGGGPEDELTTRAIADARAAGTVVFAATGNDSRQPVSFPASDPFSLAVSAMGRKGTFPPDTTQEGDVEPPFGKDKHDFIAGFSNIGTDTDLTAPGVGIISTVPGGYAVMDGTSMACPAATGVAARLLATLPSLLTMSRDQGRSDALVKAILGTAKSRGFQPEYEGQGMLLLP